MPATKRRSRGGATKRSLSKVGARKRSGGKRELLDTPRGGKRYVRRTASGEFAENQDSVRRSLAKDVKQRAKKTVRSGEGDRGDQKPRRSARKK
jgi:hypothetical protein